MRTVQSIATVLFYLARVFSLLILTVVIYAVIVLLLYKANPTALLPIRVSENDFFQILLPFTGTPFLLGDYTTSYIVSYFMIMAFYGLFLWLLADVFLTFRQTRWFTQQGVVRLSRFYITNLIVPFIFILLLVVFGDELKDIVRITLLHFVVGVFAYFMSAIFKQGLLLQEEQDLTL